MTNRGTALVVDDAEATRNRLIDMLSEFPGVRALGVPAVLEEVTAVLRELRPTVIVMDLPGYGQDGFEIVERIRLEAPAAPVILWCSHDSEEFRARSSSLGISHFLTKSADFELVATLVARECGVPVQADIPATRVLLLVEDNPADAGYVQELLADAVTDSYHIMHVDRLAAAQQKLQRASVDVVLLDLRLPDSNGAQSVRVIRASSDDVPIVVLTGSEDDILALECIQAGAQDYLTKSEMTGRGLRRAIGYAVTRTREAQLRDAQRTLAHYRSLSSSSQGTQVTAAILGSGALSIRSPSEFERLVEAYQRLLVYPGDAARRERSNMEWIITALGDAGGGPRDLVDVHVEALERSVASQPPTTRGSTIPEARLLALEMMGLLVDYYRVGHRRRFREDTHHDDVQAQVVHHRTDSAVPAGDREPSSNL